MSEDEITFDYVNENPEVKTDNAYGYYEKSNLEEVSPNQILLHINVTTFVW
jgi:hypothetical protein